MLGEVNGEQHLQVHEEVLGEVHTRVQIMKTKPAFAGA